MSTSGSLPVISRNRDCRSISSLVAPIPIPQTSESSARRERDRRHRRSRGTDRQERPLPLLPDFAEQMALYSVHQGVRYDVVHAHYWLSGWAAELARRYWETPFVQMFHTTAHMKNAVAAHDDRESDLRLRTEKRLLTLADGIIAANPDERADLIWRMGVPTEKSARSPRRRPRVVPAPIEVRIAY